MIDAAIVLCGGRSLRMGIPKALLRFGPELLLERVVRMVSATAREVVLVAAPEHEQMLPAFPAGGQIVRDPISGQGPLQGIVTGLSSLSDRAELVYVTAVDAPFLNPQWIESLTDLLDTHDVVVPFVAGRYHPLSALYRRSRVLPASQTLLESGGRRLSLLIEALDCRILTEEVLESIDPGLQTLRNLNTPDEYHKALEEAGLSGCHEPNDHVFSVSVGRTEPQLRGPFEARPPRR